MRRYRSGGSRIEQLQQRRLLAAAPGTLDTAFGENGVAGLPIEHETQDVEMLPGGKILIAGIASAPRSPLETNKFLLARFNVDGSLDTTFGDNGMVVRDFGDSNDASKNIILLPDGRFVVTASYRISGERMRYNTLRFRAGGALDMKFDKDGVLPGFGAQILLDDGRLLARRNDSVRPPPPKFVQINPSGARDSTFSGDGTFDVIAETPVARINGSISIAKQADGDLLFAVYGSLDSDALDNQSDGILLRVNARGEFAPIPTEPGVRVVRGGSTTILDSTVTVEGNKVFWGTDERVRVLNADTLSDSKVINSLPVTEIRRILVQSNGQLNVVSDLSVSRLTTEYGLDRRVTPDSSISVFNNLVAISSDGDIYTGARTSGTGRRVSLQKYEGSPDNRAIVNYGRGDVRLFGTRNADDISIIQNGSTVTAKINGISQQFNAGDRAWRIFGEGGDDRVLFQTTGTVIAYLDAGNDRMIVNQVQQDRPSVNAWGGSGNDRIEVNVNVRGTYSIARLYGDDGDDLLIGSNGQDRIYGGGGNDTIFGRDQSDLLIGQSGDDFIDSGGGGAKVDGGSGRDEIDGVLEPISSST